MIYHVPQSSVKTDNPDGVGAWFITFRLSVESIAQTICFSEIAERDKSRSYAIQQISTISRLVEDTKSKGMLLVKLIIWNKQ